MENKERATEFVVFCIENTAKRLGVSGAEVFRSIDGAGGIVGFLYPSYEALHTQSKDYIVDEVLSYMKENNISLNSGK